MPSSSRATPAISRTTAAAILLSFASAYLLSYALRAVNAALAPDLSRDLALDAAGLGWLSSSYFIAFAVLQWPLGTWLDRHGARRIEAALLAVASVGALLMALAESLALATLGRLLIGAGVSACLMAPLSYIRRCFPVARQAQLSLWMLVAGTSGATLATLPAAALATLIGWRGVFVGSALALALSALAIARLVPDLDLVRGQAPAGASPPPATPPPPGALALLRTPLFRRLLPLIVVIQGGLVALQTLWAGPWFVHVLGLSVEQSARVLFLIMLSLMTGFLGLSFLAPWLQARFGIQRVAMAGFWLNTPVLALIAIHPSPGAWGLWIVLILTLPLISMMQPAVAATLPRQVAGRALTLYNLFLFLGAFVLQWGMGVVIDLLQRAGMGYAPAFRLMLGGLALAQALLLYRAWRAGSRHPGGHPLS